MPAETFEQRTRTLLVNRPRSVEYVHIATACNLKEWWLSQFANAVDRDYGVRKVQRLHDYLVKLAA